MKIDIILPYKEIFSEQSASAVSLTVKNSIEFSKYKKYISIYGQHTDNPFYKGQFVGIKTNKIFHFGNNLSIIKNYLKLFKLKKNKDLLIEIHNRPYLFNYLVNYLNEIPIVLYYHNDPTTMKGSKSIKERQKILKNAAGIIFVSEYIKKQFFKGIKLKSSKVYVLPNGIKRDLKKIPKKTNKVMFVGRLVKEKGAHIFVNAIKNLIHDHKKWNFCIVGASKAGQKNLKTNYEKDLIKSFLKYGERAKYFGFLSNTNVKSMMNSSSILVVPSIWDDPFPLSALEGLASAQAVIASSRGGLPEMLKHSGILIKNINVKTLESKLKELINNKKKLKHYQKKAWKNFKYDQKNISKKQDLIRKEIFSNFINK
tara:strand:+ start:1301 stop:2407 length:1107 start_codon:yes stop_codon:yes gene_type:complete